MPRAGQAAGWIADVQRSHESRNRYTSQLHAQGSERSGEADAARPTCRRDRQEYRRTDFGDGRCLYAMRNAVWKEGKNSGSSDSGASDGSRVAEVSPGAWAASLKAGEQIAGGVIWFCSDKSLLPSNQK